MVHFASSLLVAVALFSHGALSGQSTLSCVPFSLRFLSRRSNVAPAPDSAINEPGVIAPNGTPITLSSPGPKPTPTIMMEDPASSSMKESPTPVKYGSGNNGYNTGYNDCVQSMLRACYSMCDVMLTHVARRMYGNIWFSYDVEYCHELWRVNSNDAHNHHPHSHWNNGLWRWCHAHCHRCSHQRVGSQHNLIFLIPIHH